MVQHFGRDDWLCRAMAAAQSREDIARPAGAACTASFGQLSACSSLCHTGRRRCIQSSALGHERCYVSLGLKEWHCKTSSNDSMHTIAAAS